MFWLMLLTTAFVTAVAWWVLEKRRRATHPVPHGDQADLEFPHEQEFELYHNAHPVYESHEQIRYVADFAPEGAQSLVPEDSALRAEMEEWIDRSSLTEHPLNNADKTAGNAIPGQALPLFCTMVEKVPYLRIFEGLLFHFDRLRPLLFIVLKLRGIENIHKIAPAAQVIAATRRHMAGHLDALEARLEKSGGPWILGDQYTLADVSWLVIFERMRQADSEGVFFSEANRPLGAAYWQRLRQRPAYAEAILAHSHPLIEYGRQRIGDAKASSADVRICLEGR